MNAIVLETRGKEAAVLVRDGTFHIVSGRFNVGETIEFRAPAAPKLRHWFAAAAAMVAMTAVSAGMWVNNNYVAVAEVSLDVNPSIVYTINRRDRVLKVRAANEDAAPIVESLDDLRFRPLSEAVEQTLGVLEVEGYLSEDTEDYVLVNVSTDDSARQDRLSSEVEQALQSTRERDATLEYRIDRSDRETAREAESNGMSAGRYAAWQEDEGEREDYLQKPVREIIGKAGEAAHPEEAQQDASPDGNTEPTTNGPTDTLSPRTTFGGEESQSGQTTPPMEANTMDRDEPRQDEAAMPAPAGSDEDKSRASVEDLPDAAPREEKNAPSNNDMRAGSEPRGEISHGQPDRADGGGPGPR